MNAKKRIPDALTAFRLVAGLPISYLAAENNWTGAFVLVVAGYLSDLIDGPLARQWYIESENGQYFDLVADVIFDIALVTILAFEGKVLPLFACMIAATALVIRLPGFIPNAYKFGTPFLPIWAWGMAYTVYCYAASAGLGKWLLTMAVPLIFIVAWFKRRRIRIDVEKALHHFL